jgi:hypothetical protein
LKQAHISAENIKTVPEEPKPANFKGSSHLQSPLTSGKLTSLPAKAKDWAVTHPGLAIGGAASVGLLAALAASAYPLWKKVIKPRLAQMKREKATGRHVKRGVDDDYLDELLEDPELIQFLTDMAAELEE